MNIKVLRAKTDLSQKAFGERICVKAQTIQKYESGERNIPETVQKLIRYEFAEYLPEEDRLTPSVQPSINNDKAVINDEIKRLKEELATAHAMAIHTESLEEMIKMQNKTIALLEEQVQLYKEKLNFIEKLDNNDTKSKTA